MQWSFIDVTTTDPAFNLALEQYVFDDLPRDRAWFLLWQNRRAVIIGRHQNTLAEINAAYVREQDIQVVRRLSGGGAVYHDLGNLNFTFIQDARSTALDLAQFCLPVARALQSMGADAQVNGRNDITIDGKKFSGNAQYVRQGRVMHHGTILFDSDLEVVSRALQVDPEKIRAKGVASVRSRTTNLRPYLPASVTLADFKARLLAEIFRGQAMEPYQLTQADLDAVLRIREQRYGTWAWNYGASPPCSLVRKSRFEGCGTVEAHLDLVEGHIAALRFYGDFFSASEPEALARALVGLPLEASALEAALAALDVGMFFNGMEEKQLISLLLGN